MQPLLLPISRLDVRNSPDPCSQHLIAMPRIGKTRPVHGTSQTSSISPANAVDHLRRLRKQDAAATRPLDRRQVGPATPFAIQPGLALSATDCGSQCTTRSIARVNNLLQVDQPIERRSTDQIASRPSRRGDLFNNQTTRGVFVCGPGATANERRRRNSAFTSNSMNYFTMHFTRVLAAFGTPLLIETKSIADGVDAPPSVVSPAQ